MNEQQQQQLELKVFHLKMAEKEVEEAISEGTYMNYTIHVLREYLNLAKVEEARIRDSDTECAKVISSTTTKGNNNMINPQDALTTLIEAITKEVLNTLDERLADVLDDYDFSASSSFTDEVTSLIESKTQDIVEDLLSGASISI